MHERYRRQTDGRSTAYSEREREFAKNGSYTSRRGIIMVALCNRADHYIFILFLLLYFFFLSFFSSPNLSGRRLDVYHTLAHGVAFMRI